MNNIKTKRIESIDLLRGAVMIIMALDHVRNYFNYDAYLFDPVDLARTNIPIFFTRWITHYCAPVFVFLAGASAYLYGSKRSRAALSFFLFTRGLWLVLAEAFIISLEWSFNPTYPYFNLQVIWAIGISMMVLSALVHLNRSLLLVIATVLIAGHNLLDNVHAPANSALEVIWSALHEPRDFAIGSHTLFIHYPVLPWIGVMTLGYCFGRLYTADFNRQKRQRILLWAGWGAITAFILLRAFNVYGDAAPWSFQKNAAFTVLSFLNVTKYPPSLLYVLMTLGPACFFLALTEKPLASRVSFIATFGRVPFFYYMAHLLLIHVFAIIAVMIAGYHWYDMILWQRVNRTPALKGFGFDLLTVYSVWATVVIILYPFCSWFDRYKRKHQATQKWLSYL